MSPVCELHLEGREGGREGGRERERKRERGGEGVGEGGREDKGGGAFNLVTNNGSCPGNIKLSDNYSPPCGCVSASDNPIILCILECTY